MVTDACPGGVAQWKERSLRRKVAGSSPAPARALFDTIRRIDTVRKKTMVMDEKPDAALVAKALAGEREAFCALVRRYQDYAYGAAIGMLSDFDLARDVAQEAFFQAYRNLRKLRDRARFAGWLRGIVRNTALRAIRELSQVGKMAEDLGHTSRPFATTPSPEESAEDAERRELVHEALGRLNEKNREAVSLYYVDGLSYGEIADFLDVNPATVKGRIQRGRAQLRKDLLNMVEETFKKHELPEDFAAEVARILGDADTRKQERDQALRRLAEIGAPAVDPLCEALSDPSYTVRLLAARALCAIGDPRALRPLLRILYGKDNWRYVKIFYGGGALRVPGIREEMLRLLREGDRGQQWLALRVLQHARDDTEVFDCVLAAFHGRGGVPLATRCGALSALCELRPEDTMDLVTEALSDPDIATRSGWAWWTAMRKGLVLPIDTCLLGFGARVAPISRWMAGRVMLRHGDHGVRALEGILRDGPRDHRATAAVALSERKYPEAFPTLLAELLDGHGPRKWLRIVGRLLMQRYADELTTWADTHPDQASASSWLAWPLARLRMARGSATPEDVFRHGPPAARAAGLRELARAEGARCLPQLRRCLREGRPGKLAHEAFHQMRRLGEAAMPTVMEMLESDPWTERKAAVCLLRRWGKLTPEQQEKAQADPHIAVRHAAESRT